MDSGGESKDLKAAFADRAISSTAIASIGMSINEASASLVYRQQTQIHQSALPPSPLPKPKNQTPLASHGVSLDLTANKVLIQLGLRGPGPFPPSSPCPNIPASCPHEHADE